LWHAWATQMRVDERYKPRLPRRGGCFRIPGGGTL
jgi:hypothetical protein